MSAGENFFSRESPCSDDRQPKLSGGFLSPRTLLLLVAGYFLLHLVVRIVVSPCVDLDEAEQVVLTQQLSLGYGSQPPLYSWIQRGVFQFFGLSVFSLSLLKNTLLFGTYLLTYLCARRLTRSPAGGMMAILALFYVPQVIWESQRDLTHSVLASFFSMATLYCFLLIQDERRTRDYVLLGVCAGLGILAKYNYAFWFIGLLAGSLMVPSFRPAIFDQRIVWSFGLAILFFLPHGLWMQSHQDQILMTASKFDAHKGLSYFNAVAGSVKHLLRSYCEVLIPLIVVCVVVFWVGRSPRQNHDIAARTRWLAATFISVLALLAVAVVVFRVTGSRGRWLQPMLVAAPVLAAGICHEWLTAKRIKVMALISLIAMMLTLVILPGRLVIAERLHRNETITKPYEKLAAELRPHIPPSTRIVAPTTVIAGNLRLVLSDNPVTTPELAGLFQNASEHCVLVWEVTNETQPPDGLLLWAQTQTDLRMDPSAAIYVSDLYRYAKNRRMRMGMLQIY